MFFPEDIEDIESGKSNEYLASKYDDMSLDNVREIVNAIINESSCERLPQLRESRSAIELQRKVPKQRRVDHGSIYSASSLEDDIFSSSGSQFGPCEYTPSSIYPLRLEYCSLGTFDEEGFDEVNSPVNKTNILEPNEDLIYKGVAHELLKIAEEVDKSQLTEKIRMEDLLSSFQQSTFFEYADSITANIQGDLAQLRVTLQMIRLACTGGYRFLRFVREQSAEYIYSRFRHTLIDLQRPPTVDLI